MTVNKDIGVATIVGLGGGDPWMGIHLRYLRGPERLSPDAREVLMLALAYGKRQVPARNRFYEDQKQQAIELGHRYLSDKRIKVALKELKDRGFYGVRKVSAGPGCWVTLRSFCNLPFKHVEELEARPRDEIIREYFPERATAVIAGPATAEVEISVPDEPIDEVTIGSGERCRVRITGDPEVVDVHATVHRVKPGVFWIVARSERGPTVIKRGMNEHVLNAGARMQLVRTDVIVVGSTWLPWNGGFR
jgi:hypothetical protein